MLHLLLLLGCGPGWFEPGWLDAEPARAPIPALEVDGIVLRAVATTSPVPAPTLWDEPLPAGPYDLGEELYPVVDGICFGATGAREAALPVLAEPEWALLLAGCADPGFCSWAVSHDALLAASGCPDPALIERFAEPDAPDVAVARWFATQARSGRPLDHPRLHEAALRLATAAEDDATVEALQAIVALPGGQARLAALAPRAGAQWVVAEIERQAQQDPAVADPLADLDAAVRHPRVHLRELARRHPNHRSAILSALAGCARDTADRNVGHRCLLALGSVDRQAARALVAELDLAELDHSWQTAAKSLERYADGRSLVEDLVRRGLLDEGSSVDAGVVTPVDAMGEGGRALALEVWGDDAQGWLLRRLAAAAGLQDVRFIVQSPLPAGEEAVARTPLRTMLAWHEGVRWRALARDYGVYGDLDQAVGLINTLLEASGKTDRVVVSDGEVTAYWAVVGDPDALQGLADEGLLRAWVPGPVAIPDEGYGYEATVEP